MKSEPHLISTILELSKGAKVYAAIEERCKTQTPPRSLRDLCGESKVGMATIWRMKNAKTVANIRPLAKLEAVFRKWERGA
jgi:hypothetical protein